MNIYANKGSKVRFVNPDSGTKDDRQKAKIHLELNASYTVERTVVHHWSTDVYLKEIPGTHFNSVLFEDDKVVQQRDREEFWTWAEAVFEPTVREMRRVWRVEMMARNSEYN